tara:strand:+ start:1915 stop:2631 length:717 start_codon:yes stop_codon:yes gene_type:complete
MTEQNTTIERYSKEFLDKVNAFNKDWFNFYKKISKEKTPEVDGNGKKIILAKGNTGYDYIDESYMRLCLDKHFPGWSWEAAAPLHFLGSEWVVAQGHLLILDKHLIAFGINPPYRKFYGVDSVRIQYKQGSVHTDPKNIVDVGDNCKQANTSAMKYAINRLTHIGDDVYGKRIEDVGAGSFEELVTMGSSSPDIKAKAFNELVKSKRMPWSKVFEVLEIKSLTEITDYGKAYTKLKES